MFAIFHIQGLWVLTRDRDIDIRVNEFNIL